MASPLVAIRQPDRQTLYLMLREPLELGRECGGLLLADPQASRRHAELRPVPGGIEVEDLGSTNGTRVDGVVIDRPVIVRQGQVIGIGQTSIDVVSVDAPRVRPPSPPTLIGESTGEIGVPVKPMTPRRSDPRQTSIDIVAAAVASQKPDYGALPDDQGTVTIVFSDIEASTQRAVALGDTEWLAVLNEHNEIVRRAVARYGGSVIKSQGDGFMLSFPGARRALEAMTMAQRGLEQHATANPDRGVRIRVGMHTGEVLVDDEGDLFGKHVIMAARIANLAAGGEILVSSLVREILSSRGDIAFGEPRNVELKGIEGVHAVYPVPWRPQPSG